MDIALEARATFSYSLRTRISHMISLVPKDKKQPFAETYSFNNYKFLYKFRGHYYYFSTVIFASLKA